MKTVIKVQEQQIKVQLEPHIIRITTDDELIDLLRRNVKKSTAELVSAIKTKYQQQFNTGLKISNRSMAVEIWGHAYADRLAKWIQTFTKAGFINKITNKVIYHAQLIDIGEKGHDGNRIVWDCLAPFLSIIAFFLP